jgi:hypothetical protein
MAPHQLEAFHAPQAHSRQEPLRFLEIAGMVAAFDFPQLAQHLKQAADQSTNWQWCSEHLPVPVYSHREDKSAR